MNKLLIFVLLLCVIGEVCGHAVLFSPTPWWVGASRTQPCGGANATYEPRAIWPVGSNQTITWWVQATDGGGTVYGLISTDGSLNFTNGVPVVITQPKITTLGYFRLSLIVPDVTCNGPNHSCFLQLWTPSGRGWYTCTTINITCTGCAAGYPISRDDCVQAPALEFCPKKSGSSVLVPDGETAVEIDDLTSAAFLQNHPNPLVFSNGNSSSCLTLYQQFLCELYLSPCGNSTSSYTQQMCQKTLDTCEVTALHKTLYNCSVFPSPASSSQNIQWIVFLFILIAFVL